MQSQSKKLLVVRALLIFSVGVGSLVILGLHQGGWFFGISIYGTIAVTYLLTKLLAAAIYQPITRRTPALSTAVVIPFYNEDPLVFEHCLDSVLQQSVPPDEIYILDDGSIDDACHRIALTKVHPTTRITVCRYPVNRGKRHAQSEAFSETRCDVIVTIDSDTVLDQQALEEGLKPFRDPKVMSVCGNVRVLNARDNLLTRLIDLRYSNAFVYERAAYSAMDSVLCATGVLTLWRSRVIKDNYWDYLHQRFLGVEVSYGDDRRLTNYALLEGRACFQSTCVAWTLAPTRLSHFLRQQVRWNKSFFRETLFALRHLPKTRLVWWFALAELALWVGFTVALITGVLVRPVIAGQIVGFYYFGFVAVMAYMRSAMHATRDPFGFFLAPMYGLIHILLLTPIRVYSLCTLRDGSWGTRGEGMEIAFEGQLTDTMAPLWERTNT